jgi:hypothetical protein
MSAPHAKPGGEGCLSSDGYTSVSESEAERDAADQYEAAEAAALEKVRAACRLRRAAAYQLNRGRGFRSFARVQARVRRVCGAPRCSFLGRLVILCGVRAQDLGEHEGAEELSTLEVVQRRKSRVDRLLGLYQVRQPQPRANTLHPLPVRCGWGEVEPYRRVSSAIGFMLCETRLERGQH